MIPLFLGKVRDNDYAVYKIRSTWVKIVFRFVVGQFRLKFNKFLKIQLMN